MSSMVTSGAVIGAAPEMVPLVERSMRFVVSLKLYIHIGSDALPYGWNVSIVVPSVQSFAPPVLPTHPVEPSYVLPMRTERAMPSNAMFRLFMTDCSACAFLLAFTSERSAPTQTTMTTENSPMATIISTRVKPREVFRISYFVFRIFDFLYHIPDSRYYIHSYCAASLCTDIWPLAPTTTLITSPRGERRTMRALSAHVPAPYAHPTPPALIHASASGRLNAMSSWVAGVAPRHVAASVPCGAHRPLILNPLRMVYGDGATFSLGSKKPSLSTSAKNS